MTTSIDTTIRLAALAIAAFALPIRAATFTVGGGIDGRTCDFGSLQEAVDAAAAAAGPDTIRITRSLGAEVGGIVVHDDAPLQLEGGYESCLDPVADRAATALDFGSAVGIRHDGAAALTVRWLDLTSHAAIVVRTGSGSLDVVDSAIHDAHDFAGILASGDGSVNLVRTALSANLAGISMSGGTLSISDSRIEHNATGVVLSQAEATISGTTIAGNGVDAVGEAGGIRLGGFGGSLELAHSTILDNRSAFDGAGIRAEGGDAAHPVSLRIGAGVLVSGNVATGSGGGIHARHAHVDMTDAPGTAISDNASGVFGGGIALFAGSADIASSSDAGLAISGNYAEFAGGGVFAGEGAQVRLFRTSGGAPLRMQGNGTGPTSSFGGAIAVVQAPATAATRLLVLDARIEANEAVQGGGVALVSEENAVPAALCVSTAAVRARSCDGLEVPAQAAACAAAEACMQLVANRNGPLPSGAEGAQAIAAGGAAVALWGPSGHVRVDHARIGGNEGATIIAQSSFTGSGSGVLEVSDSLVARNQAQAALVRLAGDAGTLAIRRSTLAGNEIDGVAVIDVTGAGSTLLHEAVVFQPGASVYCCSWDALDARYLLGHESDSLPPGPTILAGDPRFVDADAGDYRLADDSPALDVSDLVEADDPDRDLDGNPRGFDLAGTPDLFGPRDLGAYERVASADLVFADGFDGDGARWPRIGSGRPPGR